MGSAPMSARMSQRMNARLTGATNAEDYHRYRSSLASGWLGWAMGDWAILTCGKEAG